MRNLPETPIMFLVYSPKSYFLAFLRPQTRVSGLRLKLTNAMRVVTQDFGRQSKLKFLVVIQVIRMSSRS
jgi:hypothetical protein